MGRPARPSDASTTRTFSRSCHARNRSHRDGGSRHHREGVIVLFSEAYVSVLNLVYRYPELIDSGDFEGIGRLFAHATIDTGDGTPISGASTIQEMYERNTRRFA